METSNRSSQTIRHLACIERKNGTEQLRIDLDEFTDNKGKSHRYVSARKWFRTEDGRLLPTKEGFTIRRNELGTALRALHEAHEFFVSDGSEQSQPVVRHGRSRDTDPGTEQQSTSVARDPF